MEKQRKCEPCSHEAIRLIGHLSTIQLKETSCVIRPCTRAGNGWFRGVSDHCSFTLITANCIIPGPSGRPTNVTAIPNITSILLMWRELDCSERNSRISHYLVTYDRGRAVNVTQTMLLLDELRPATGYTVSLAAVNMNGERGPAYTMATRTLTPPTPAPEGIDIPVGVGLNTISAGLACKP